MNKKPRTKSKEFFTHVQKMEPIYPLPQYFHYLIKIIQKRCESLDFDVYRLFEEIGTHSSEMRQACLIHYNTPVIELALEAHIQNFYLKLGILTKFLYPVIEQMDTAVDKNFYYSFKEMIDEKERKTKKNEL